jgi:hypothetical protein
MDLPATERQLYLRLADEFDENPLAMHLTPQELTDKLGIGNRHLWQNFLQLEPVKNYIKAQMKFNAQVASRKAFAALERQASNGDTQAARHVNDLAGIFDQQDQRRIVVLHQITRSKPQQNTPPKEKEVVINENL